MRIWDGVPIIAALLLASAAALTSSDSAARENIGQFVAEALSPQAADLGGDPGYLLGNSPDTVWTLPPPRGSGGLADGQD
nr:hypothetical protein [uncultured Rhodopila sp.]